MSDAVTTLTRFSLISLHLIFHNPRKDFRASSARGTEMYLTNLDFAYFQTIIDENLEICNLYSLRKHIPLPLNPRLVLGPPPPPVIFPTTDRYPSTYAPHPAAARDARISLISSGKMVYPDQQRNSESIVWRKINRGYSYSLERFYLNKFSYALLILVII